MKMMKWLFPLFVVVALVQLVVPAGMIVRRELTLKEGKIFKFHAQPVDPYDAFRGRYVTLSLEPNSVTVPTNSSLEYQWREVYITLDEGPDGFARFTGVFLEPQTGKDYIKTKSAGLNEGKLSLRLPFDRFYMEESTAPKAERAYLEHSKRGQQDAFVTIRVSDGFAVLENFYVAGKPITEFVKE